MSNAGDSNSPSWKGLPAPADVSQRPSLNQQQGPTVDRDRGPFLTPQPPRFMNGRSANSTIRTVSGGATGPFVASSAGGTGSFNSPISGSVQTSLPTPVLSNSVGSSTTDPGSERLETLMEKLEIEKKMKEGAERVLLALDSSSKRARNEAEKALNAANFMIEELTSQVDIINTRKALHQQQLQTPKTRLAAKFQGEPLLATPGAVLSTSEPNSNDLYLSTESPTWSLSDILQSLEEKNRRPEFYVEKANGMVHLLKRHPTLKYDLVWSAFGKRVQFMLCHEAKEVAAAGYRIVRHAITDLKSLQMIRSLNTDIVVINTLAKEHSTSDARSNVEREQALKFVRAFIEVPGGHNEISKCVVRALVSCAEQSDDRLRAMCTETLAELLVLDASLVVDGGGVRVLVQALTDGPHDLSDTLTIAFLYLLDMPSTRIYVRPGHDLEIVVSAFTDSHPKAHVHEDRLRSSARVICSVLKTWPGLLSFSMFRLRAIRSLVDALHIPVTSVRDVILDMLFDLFRIKSPSWSSSFLAGRRLTTYGRVTNLKPTNVNYTSHENNSHINLVDHFLALLLAIFLDAGLMKGLLAILHENTDALVSRKSTLLIGELLKLANRLLPQSINTKLQLLPGLFSTAASYGREQRFPAAAAVYQLDRLSRTLHRSLPISQSPVQRSLLDDEKRGQRQVEQMKLKMNLQLDDGHFRSLLLDTQILTTKNYTKWNWDILLELIQGPLVNPKRLDEAMKATKFLKRLFSFFRPFKFRFSAIKNTKPNQRYVKVGCALFHTLLQNPDGIKLLGDNKILRQVAECLAQLDPMSGISSPDPLFSKSRLSETLSSGYFTMLGVLSSDSRGLVMMDRWKMFNMFYHISELRSRDDVMFCFISAMDFTLEGHPRIILSKALTTGQKGVRLFATNHLRSLVKGLSSPHQEMLSDLSAPSKATETSEWAIRLLVTQLYDPDVEVCETAVKILEEACNAPSSLEYVVKCRPTLDHLGEIGAPLLLRFLSTSIGYHYLDELDYINREMDDWFHGRNDAYVDHVEASLARAFADDDRPRKGIDGNIINDADMIGVVPPHFYRELARTNEGCRLLKEKGHFEEFSLFIREHGLESEDLEIVTKVKGCLWAVGNIGSLPSGATFLDQSDAVQSIVKVAELSQVLSVKGTAFFVLGLISRSIHGLEILDELGWDSSTTTMGESLGFCIPTDLGRLLSLQPWYYAGGESIHINKIATHETGDPTVPRILNAVANLSNHILANEASKELVKLKTTHAALFQSPELYQRALLLLESYRYRLPVRRFILDLFDKKMVERIVKEVKEVPLEYSVPSSVADHENG